MTHEDDYLRRMAMHWNRDPIRHGVFCFLLLLWVGDVLWREGRLT